ncbi:MAG: hypothetical protein QE271_09705 [Bacteriovoracaceae bacterium]|nr:hypothetical protein [Bacteriovoracaceae bacterium]
MKKISLLFSIASIVVSFSTHADTFFQFDAASMDWQSTDSGSVRAKKLVANKQDYQVDFSSSYAVKKGPLGSLQASLPGGLLDFGLSVGPKMKSILFKELNLLINETNNKLSLEHFSSVSVDKGESSIDLLSANCTPKVTDGNFLSAIFANCFTKGSVKIKSVIFPNMISGEDITLNVDNGNFNLRGYMLVPAEGVVKLGGTSKFDAQNNQLVIELKSAKLDIFNIKGRLFKEFRKIKSDSIKVQEPFIYINLKR